MSTQEDRYVFKFMGSFGPGGTFGLFTEKICQVFFNDAYEQHDPKQMQVDKKNEEIQKERAEYVDELFEQKGGWTRGLESDKPESNEAAYQGMADLINKYKTIISRHEQSRLARERLFYKPDSVQYKKRMEMSKNVSEDVADNLIKMALHIVKAADKDVLTSKVGFGGSGSGDVEYGEIEQRVPVSSAQQYLKEWKKILYAYEKEGNDLNALYNQTQGTGMSASLIGVDNPDLEGLKDKLFIVTGEDLYDTFLAFEKYNLDQHLSDEDRRVIDAGANQA
jgi:hypothetical protein